MATQPLSPAKTNDSALVTGMVVAIAILVAALIGGGFWMQNQRTEEAERMQAERTYENYLEATQPVQMAQPPAGPTARELAAQEARATRKFLMEHPAVTPGEGFDKPGVQATGKAIVQAIDNAKGL